MRQIRGGTIFRRSHQHLAAGGETYGEHFRFAITVALLAIAAGLACLIHAFVPALCTRTCSTIVARLQRLFVERCQLEQVAEQSSGAIAFVGLLVLATGAALIPWLGGANIVFTLMIAALALAIPSVFLLTKPELDSVRAPA